MVSGRGGKTLMSAPLKPAGAVIAIRPATRVPIPRGRFPGLSPRAYCLVVDGDSLRPRFASGDLIVIDPDRPPVPGDAVVIYGKAEVGEFAADRIGLMHVIVGTEKATGR